ncbi:hypothetical protein [Thalassovita taeanensis]|uniref:hypothetical protein n=1 Tax=Thalassovita taeanensis TaxID=657014 RepID=UPI001FEBFA76|nr:hypothetical protein [Thalassovita taeanensis]
MSFLRPEAQAALRRWREPVVALGIVLIGVRWALIGLGPLRWIGGIVVLAGAAGLGFVALRRARFARMAGGAGLVEVDEGVVSYFGPVSGGSLAISALSAIRLLRMGEGQQVWLLSAPGEAPLHIPVDAEGSEALFDVFAALPGMQTEAMLRALRRPASDDVLIWRSNPMRLH